MSAKILVVDDVPANVRLLEAKLAASFYEVVTARDGAEAIEAARRERPDLILLDVMMPEMDGFTACRVIKADPDLATIPVVMITALDQPRDRLRGLEAGADDFLTKPPNDTALFARVRSLVRVKMTIDELRMRDETLGDFGGSQSIDDLLHAPVEGKVLILDERQSRARVLAEILERRLNLEAQAVGSRREALAEIQDRAADLFVIASGARRDGQVGAEPAAADGVSLCSELRSRPESRQSAILLIADDDDYATIAAGLDVGANDYVLRPVEEAEFVARVAAQLRRKRYADKLRENLQAGLQMAMTDALTGLYNRRYAEKHLSRQAMEADRLGGPLSVALLDIDHFKRVNDTHGHAVGDEVLVEFARRVAEHVRGIDMLARFGGEEFLLSMPETSLAEAGLALERIRKAVCRQPFRTATGALAVTVSLGVAERRARERPEATVARADAALYRAKAEGRDRVAMCDGGSNEAPDAAPADAPTRARPDDAAR